MRTATCLATAGAVASWLRPQWQTPAQTGQLIGELREPRAAEARARLYQLYQSCYFRRFRMRRRTCWFITAAMVCQLLPVGGAVTNGFLLWARQQPENPSPPTAAQEQIPAPAHKAAATSP